jgi:PEP-CTERM motif
MNQAKVSLLSISLLALSLAAGSTVYADTIVVAPNANTSTNGSTFQVAFLGEPGPATFQIDIAASQLTSLVGESINAIGFRLRSGAASVPSLTLNGFSLELSGSANPIGSLSTTQSANIGANAQMVDSGTLVLSGLVGGSGPNPFFLINFSTPYLYTGGGDLLITDSYTSSSVFFLGVDATPVGSIMDTSAKFGVDNLAQFFDAPVTELVATSATTPEPGSLVLLGTGIAGLAGMLRKRFV